MAEYENAKVMKFSKDLKTPIELSSMESWMKDKCKLMESGKVLTKISRRTCCFQLYHRMSSWHLYHIIRTTDDVLIIFTAPKKGFVLSLSSAIYLKITRSETSTGKRICKVKLKWKFGKVKLKFAENQIFIWRQRFLSTFGRIGETNKNIKITTTKKKQSDKTSKREIENEEWDSTTSAMSLASDYALRLHSSKSSEYLKHIGSITLYSDTEKNESPLVTFHKEQSCNCRHLLGLINRNNNQSTNKAELQNNPISTTIKNSCKESMENNNSMKEKNNLSVDAAQSHGKNYNSDKTDKVKNSNHTLSPPKLSESNA